MHPAAQIVFVDTPGVHKPGSHLDRRMLQEVYEALETRDVVLVLMDATRRVQLEAAAAPAVRTSRNPRSQKRDPRQAQAALGHPVRICRGRGNPDASLRQDASCSQKHERTNWASEDEFLFGLIRKLDCPVFLVLTKIDLVPKDQLLPLIDTLTRQFNFAQIIPVSARKRDGLDLLVRKIVDALPTGERYYPKDQYTDQPQRFMVAELIRESILVETGEEVPYASAVVIERFEEPRAVCPAQERRRAGAAAADAHCRGNLLRARWAEGDSDRQGRREAEGDRHRRAAQIESLLGTRVYLELHVIVEPNWRESKSFVESLDWRNQLERLGVDQSTEADQTRKNSFAAKPRIGPSRFGKSNEPLNKFPFFEEDIAQGLKPS